MFVFPELFLLTGGRGRDEGDGRRHSRSGERHAGGVGLKVLRVVGSGEVWLVERSGCGLQSWMRVIAQGRQRLCTQSSVHSGNTGIKRRCRVT
jgi:hypothetical protein